MIKGLIVIVIFSISLSMSPATPKQSDREHEGFVGSVKTVTTYLSAVSGNWQSTPRGKQCKFRTVIYDLEGRLIQNSLFPECSQGAEFRNSFTYDKDGNRYDKHETIASQTGIPSGPPPAAGPPFSQSEVTNDPKTIFKYDDQGKKVEELGFFTNGKIKHRFVYKYDEKGRLYEILRFYPEEKSPRKTSYSYLEGQRFPTAWTEYYADGKVSEKYTFSDYVLNSMGDWIKRKALIIDDTGKRVGIESRQIEYYPVKK